MVPIGAITAPRWRGAQHGRLLSVCRRRSFQLAPRGSSLYQNGAQALAEACVLWLVVAER